MGKRGEEGREEQRVPRLVFFSEKLLSPREIEKRKKEVERTRERERARENFLFKIGRHFWMEYDVMPTAEPKPLLSVVGWPIVV
jgi:hypothetical protein